MSSRERSRAHPIHDKRFLENAKNVILLFTPYGRYNQTAGILHINSHRQTFNEWHLHYKSHILSFSDIALRGFHLLLFLKLCIQIPHKFHSKHIQFPSYHPLPAPLAPLHPLCPRSRSYSLQISPSLLAAVLGDRPFEFMYFLECI